MAHRSMRFSRLVVVAATFFVAVAAPAQTVAPRGEAGTFEVATWNLEFFGVPSLGPSNDALQLQNVAAVIEQSDIDLWAFQEVVDADEWSELLRQLQAAGYSGRLGPQVSSDSRFDQKLAFLYDRSVVQVIGAQTILRDYDYEFAGRLPYELQARVTVGGIGRTVYVITFHAKASTGSQDYARRRDGAVALKAYIDQRAARGEEVILLGDFNDFLVGSTRSGQPSPYRAFVEDASYVTATLPLQQAGVNTYCRSSTCASGDTRDHLLFTASLSGSYLDGSADRYGEVLTGVADYVNTTSDHVPVLARFALRPVACEACGRPLPIELLPPSPNPFRNETSLRFRLDVAADVRLDVFDALGRRVASASGAYGPGEHGVSVDGARLAPGVYTVRLAAGAVVQSRTLVRVD